jgi:hypothetical protein
MSLSLTTVGCVLIRYYYHLKRHKTPIVHTAAMPVAVLPVTTDVGHVK